MEWIIGFMILLWLISLFEKNTTRPTKDFTPNTKKANELHKHDATTNIVLGTLDATQSTKSNNAHRDSDVSPNKKTINAPPTARLNIGEIFKIIEKNEKSRAEQSCFKADMVEVDEPIKIEISPEKQAIKAFVKERNIVQLIHFTRYENLESILVNGIVTREMLNTIEYDSYVNDNLRLDGHVNTISLSISFPNYKMFYKYRRSTDAKGWVVLAISPQILWEYKCKFCKHNAADSRISSREIDNLSGIDSLQEMFSDNVDNYITRSNQSLEIFDTTDPQAEVLVFDNIPIKYILAVGFESQELLSEMQNKNELEGNKHIKFMMAKKYFNSREYVR